MTAWHKPAAARVNSLDMYSVVQSLRGLIAAKKQSYSMWAVRSRGKLSSDCKLGTVLRINSA